MRMRVGGQVRTLALGAFLAAAFIAPAVASCDDSSGCDDPVKAIADSQAAAAASAAEAAAIASEKPLPLIKRKTSRDVRSARKAPVKTDPSKTEGAKASPEQTLKNARAQARDAELAKSPAQDGDLTEADRFPAPQLSMPVVSPEEANEIDDTASTTIAQPTPPQNADRPAVALDQPRLTAARVELPAGAATVASAASGDSTWDKTSLIGKIFVALGGILTAASAVRMFIG